MTRDEFIKKWCWKTGSDWSSRARQIDLDKVMNHHENEIIHRERYLAAETTWNDLTNNDTLIYDSFDDYYNATLRYRIIPLV